MLKDYVICFIKESEIAERDCRIPSTAIDAVYKISAMNSKEARSIGNEKFNIDFPDESLADYIQSCGSQHLD